LDHQISLLDSFFFNVSLVLFMLGRCSAKLGDAKSDKRWN
jgi:hypothetical protein